jgi:Thiol-disulfide isomerase and thioredoxins
MSLSLLLRCKALLVLSAFLATTSRAVQTGDLAPDFALPSLHEASIQLSSLRGRHVYLDFWASWCAPCKASFPWMNQMAERYPELTILAVNLDRKRTDAERFLSQTPARFPILFDATGQIAERYAVAAMPSSLLIGPDGRILWRHAGFRERDTVKLEEALKLALRTR